MKKIFFIMAFVFIFVANSPSYSATIDADVFLSGSDYIQSFNVTNNSTGGLNIIKVVYSLGTPADGIATWDTNTGGGAASDFLSNPQYFQTVTWSGLAIAPGTSYSIPAYSLDIDLIITLSPLNVSGSPIDNVGTSLAHAFFGVEYNDSFGLRTVALNQTGWTTSQNLHIGETAPVPATVLLLGSGLLMLGAWRRR